MKQRFTLTAEQGRITEGHYGSKPGDRFGAFLCVGPHGIMLKMIVASAETAIDDKKLAESVAERAWDHVSVSQGPGSKKPPDWEQMCWVKKQFWDDDECVVQYHPAKSDYINLNDGVLHMWSRKEGFPMPPKVMV